jgi:hypothetical protein
MRFRLALSTLAFLGLSATAGAVAPDAARAPGATLLGPICHGEPPPAIAGPHRLVMLPGMGNDHLAADTANPKAQRWFDYGLTLARSFEHADAVLAFRKAEAADPTCSLCVAGEAYARGPTINYGVGVEQTAAALELAKRAQAMAGPNVAPTIRRLEAALVDRYRALNPAADDRTYAQDLDALHDAQPDDVEAAVFDAEAWLIVQNDGEAAAARHAVAVLTPLVASHPGSSGLVHFFIHATENAGVAELAEPYAARLAELAPNASHMVHMPSHTFFRVGRYEDAALANVAAIRADRAYAERTDFPTPLGRLMYHFHDIQFGLGAAMMAGDAKLALWFVRQFNQDFPSPATYDPHAAMAAGQTYAALGRFAPPEEILAAPDTVAANPLLEAMRRYARGEAEVRLGRADRARQEAKAIVGLLAQHPAGAFASSVVVARLAEQTLEGDADLLDHDPAAAAKTFAAAADAQDALLAGDMDPPRWWFPIRRSLAAALLAEGDAKGAERETSTTLRTWKLDPEALAIRAAAERRLHDPAAAGADWQAARRGWRGDQAQLGPGFVV